MKKLTKDYGVIGLIRDLKNGLIDRDAEMQRSFVWTNKEQTEFLDSVFRHRDIYIPPIIGALTELKIDNKLVISLLDGKQRSTTLEKFLDGEITLGNNIKPVVIEQEDGTDKEYNVAGMTWNQIPDEVKTHFKSCKIQMVYFEDMNQEDMERQFIKLQGGKKLTNAEVNKVRIGQDLREFIYKQLSSDLWINSKVSGNREARFETMMQTIMIQSGKFELSGKALQEFAESAEVKPELLEQIEAITEYLDRVVNNIKSNILPEVFRGLDEEELEEKAKDKDLDKELVRAIKKYLKPIDFLKKTHIPIIYNTAALAIQNDITEDQFSEFIVKFFDKVPSKYQVKSSGKCADSASVKGRIEEMTKAFNEYFKITVNKEEHKLSTNIVQLFQQAKEEFEDENEEQELEAELHQDEQENNENTAK